MTTALIVDDEEDMRALIRAVIAAADQGLEVGGEAIDGGTAVEQCRAIRPDVVVLDQRMPDMSGIETAERLLADRPGLPIVLFSAFLDDEIRSEAERVGVRACLGKEQVDELPRALWDIVV